MKKLISIVLSVLLVCALIPMTAFAEAEAPQTPDTSFSSRKGGDKGKKEEGGKKDKGDKKDRDHHKKDKKKGHGSYEPAHDHKYNGYGCNTQYHWLQCACGCKINVEPHVDPLDTDDDYCICGYPFSGDADLVTLWLDGCEGLKNFRKDVYEYETKAYTYKEVNEIKRIATRTHDSEATVEIPEDLTLKEGENKIEVKVTSENKKVTKTYTVIVHKEPKK